MNRPFFFKIRIWFTVVITLAIGSLLVWNYTHGGVPAHHILANKDLPQISNWWELYCPCWPGFCCTAFKKRIFKNEEQVEIQLIRNMVIGFAASLLFGILLSLFFTQGDNDVTGNMMLAIFPLALFVPLYRSEYLLGFVVGMTFTFGAVLPTGVGSILLLVTAILYLYVRSAVLHVAFRLKSQTGR